MANDASRKLAAWAKKIRALPQEILAAAPEAADAARAAVAAEVAAGAAPGGGSWAPRKKGTGPVLKGAAGKIRAVADGPRIVLSITGYEAFHDRGTKSLPSRLLLPRGAIPASVVVAMARVFQRVWSALTR